MSTKLTSVRRYQLGVSLVELMVTVVVALLLLGGLIQVYLSNKQSYNAQEQLARMQESGRFAMELITRDLRRAGYWGGNVDTTSINNKVPPADACGTSSDWGQMIEWRVSGVNNANVGYPCTDANYLANTDILTIRYAGPEPVAAGVPATTPNALYLRSSLFAGSLMIGSDDSVTQVPPFAAGTPTHLLAEDRRLVSHAYFVGDGQGTCNGAAVPALHRVRLDANGAPLVEEIAPGVEQFQVQYLLDGTYQDADVDFTDARWPDVSAVRVWLLTRGECPEPGLENTATYAMGDLSQPWPAATDDFRRQLYVATIMLRNTLVR